MKVRYDHWVHLNEEGMRMFGYIFPDGMVPVKHMLKDNATLEGEQGVKAVYKIDYAQLTADQKDQCLKYMADKFRVTIRDILEYIGVDQFIPLQARYVGASGTQRVELFA